MMDTACLVRITVLLRCNQRANMRAVQFKSLEDMMAAALAVPDVNRHDLIARGLDAPDA